MASRREKAEQRRHKRAELDELRHIAYVAESYVREIFLPNIKEPRSIDRRRDDLVRTIEVRRARRGLPSLRRAA